MREEEEYSLNVTQSKEDGNHALISNDSEINQSSPPKALPPPSFPDGGTQAWIQCAAGFCIFFNTWGLLASFGAFQAFYEKDLLRGSSASQISWIGTIQSSFVMFGSVYSGPLYDWGYLRPLIGVGCFMLVLGMFMTSLCTQYWQVILAQGLFMGLGLGCLFTPTAGLIASYFSKKRGIALGIASSGTAIGGVIYPIVFYRLVSRIHFGWATRVIAFIMLFLSIIPVIGMRMRTKPAAVRRIFDYGAIKEPEFVLYALSLFIGYVGVFVPYFYLQVYCLDKKIVTGDLNVYVLPILNAGGFFGRIFWGKIADILGPINASTIASVACSALIFGWIGIKSEASAIVFSVLYGFLSAGLIILPSVCIAVSLCPDIRQLGVRITMQSIPAAIGLLIGNPIAGAILERGWTPLQAFSAATVLACAFLSGAARVAKVGWAIRGKC